MMKKQLRIGLALVAMLVLLIPAAVAKPLTTCPAGQSDKLELLVWSAEPGRTGPTITFTARSNLPKATRSISASLTFYTLEGKRLVDMPLSPGLRIGPGTTGTEDDVVVDSTMNDILRPDIATALICMRYVEYADGSYQEF